MNPTANINDTIFHGQKRPERLQKIYPRTEFMPVMRVSAAQLLQFSWMTNRRFSLWFFFKYLKKKCTRARGTGGSLPSSTHTRSLIFLFLLFCFPNPSLSCNVFQIIVLNSFEGQTASFLTLWTAKFALRGRIEEETATESKGQKLSRILGAFLGMHTAANGELLKF